MAEKRAIYLDHATIRPVKPVVMHAMRPYYSEHFGNPSSIYGIARESKKAIEIARAQVSYDTERLEWRKRRQVYQNEQ